LNVLVHYVLDHYSIDFQIVQSFLICFAIVFGKFCHFHFQQKGTHKVFTLNILFIVYLQILDVLGEMKNAQKQEKTVAPKGETVSLIGLLERMVL